MRFISTLINPFTLKKLQIKTKMLNINRMLNSNLLYYSCYLLTTSHTITYNYYNINKKRVGEILEKKTFSRIYNLIFLI